MSNKVQFGLKNVHYAVLTETPNALPTWATPVAVKGAVTMELSHETAENNFYADNTTYYRTMFNNGYTGSLEMALIPDQMLQDVWGFGYDSTNKLVYEDANAEAKPFALLFQFEGDDTETLYCLYRCFGSRPQVASATTNESGATPQTQTIDLTVLPVVDPTGTIIDGKVYVKTDENTDAAIKTAWFNSVFTALQ